MSKTLGVYEEFVSQERASDVTKTSDLCSAMCIAQNIFAAICARAAEIHCDPGHDASITARDAVMW